MEIAAKQNKLARTWELIHNISGKEKATVIKVKKLDGSLPTSEEEILNDWAKYFEKLLNANESNPSEIPKPADIDLEIETGPFSTREIDEAIDSLQNKKSPGQDSCIVSEILKYGGPYIRFQIHKICNEVYMSEKATKQWTDHLIVPVPKSGNLQLMTNYRGITLMSIAAKVYNKLLFNRIVHVIDQILRKNQAGFRKERSCIQQIHILRRIMEGANANNIPLLITFIDFKKAFDSVNRNMMFAILRHYGIPEKIVRAIKLMYEDTTSRVYIEGKLSEQFKVTTGVLQGDVLAPSLFIIVMDYVMSLSEKDFGFITHPRQSSRNPEIKINDLDYADDIALLENNIKRAQDQLDQMSKTAKEVGLEINVNKTKIMRLNEKEEDRNIQLTLNGETIENVDNFKYLGAQMISTEKDFKIRKGQAWAAFKQLGKIWKSKTTSLKLKINIFKVSCLTILMYGSETWVFGEKLRNELDSFATNCYRHILGIKRIDKVPNEIVYEMVEQQPLSITLAARQLTWVGHILRRPEEEPIKRYALYSQKELFRKGRVSRGAPKLTYIKQVSTLLNPGVKDNGIVLESKDIEKIAKDRVIWRRRVIDCTGAVQQGFRSTGTTDR